MPVLSDEHKFVFYHIQKTGGQSIMNAIEDYSIRCWRHEKLKDKGAVGHLTPEQLYDCNLEYAETLKTYFKFAFIRNPLSRLVSQYCFERQDEFWRGLEPEQARVADSLPFKKWVYKRDIQLQKDFLMYKGKIHMDYVGVCDRTMNSQFKEICKKIGLPEIELPFDHKTKHKPWREYYTEKMAQDMLKKYAPDVKMYEEKTGEKVW